MTDSSTPFNCRVCGDRINETLATREMMFGTQDKFTYRLCATCGCWQIETIPDDMARYYGDGYYAMGEPEPVRGFSRWVQRQRARHLLGSSNPIGAWAVRRYGVPPSLEWVRTAGKGLEHRILDVGCGAGHLLVKMSAYGFRNLYGVDPFVSGDATVDGVTIWCREPGDVEGAFDLVMMHHAFEHVSDPLATLQQLRQLLSADGVLLVRMPLSDSFAAEEYRADWVQLDSPRHLHIQARESFSRLAAAVGLTIQRVVYDSSAFQFWGSEQYRRGIPLMAPQSYRNDPTQLTPDAINAYTLRADRLNAEQRGDQAAFYLTLG